MAVPSEKASAGGAGGAGGSSQNHGGEENMSTQPNRAWVRNLDAQVWHELRVEAFRRRILVGVLLTRIISEWLQKERGK